MTDDLSEMYFVMITFSGEKLWFICNQSLVILHYK